jgi:uncharacterized protein (TIGR02217 family)
MADFDTVRFPPRISFGAVGGPRFMTTVNIMASGAEGRRRWWETERGEWSVSHRAKAGADAEELLAFFRVVAQGRGNTFRFKDWTDYVCPVGAGLFTNTTIGSPTLRQMVKRYSFGGFTYDRIITKPINGTITTNASGLDYATGIANTGTTWSGEFDCMVRLDDDPMKLQVVDRQAGEDGDLIIHWEGIQIVEVIFEAR